MKASIIIPSYNAENTIERAIRSVADHPPSFAYEILVIDDGSRDGTVEKVRRISASLPSLRLAEQKNGGPAAARNRGIALAQGEYLLFLDSDDAFLPGAVEKAVCICEKQKAELVIGAFQLTQGKESAYYGMPSLSSEEEFWGNLAEVYKRNLINQVWAKVFSRELMRRENLSFPSYLWGEDRLFLFKALKGAKGIAVTEEPLVDYIQQPSSLISRHLNEKPKICLEIHQTICDLAREKGVLTPEAESVFSYMYIKSLLSCLSTLSSPTCPLTAKEKISYLKGITGEAAVKRARFFPPDVGIGFSVLSFLLRKGGLAGAVLSALMLGAANRLMPSLVRKAKHVYNRNET